MTTLCVIKVFKIMFSYLPNPNNLQMYIPVQEGMVVWKRMPLPLTVGQKAKFWRLKTVSRNKTSVKPVLIDHSKRTQKMAFNTGYRLMKVKSSICKTFDFHQATIFH